VSERRAGRVTEFDAHVGLGEVESGGDTFLFHCTQIADGTREIDVDASVDFIVVTRPKGDEAYDIRKT
jgi:cold shock CspA family protein